MKKILILFLIFLFFTSVFAARPTAKMVTRPASATTGASFDFDVRCTDTDADLTSCYVDFGDGSVYNLFPQDCFTSTTSQWCKKTLTHTYTNEKDYADHFVATIIAKDSKGLYGFDDADKIIFPITGILPSVSASITNPGKPVSDAFPFEVNFFVECLTITPPGGIGPPDLTMCQFNTSQGFYDILKISGLPCKSYCAATIKETYTTAGLRKTKLTAMNDITPTEPFDKKTQTIEDTVYIGVEPGTQPPKSGVSAKLLPQNKTGNAPLTVSFTATCTDDFQLNYCYINYGDGSQNENVCAGVKKPTDKCGGVFSHTYSTPKETPYNVILTAQNFQKQQATDTSQITVTEGQQPPTPPPTPPIPPIEQCLSLTTDEKIFKGTNVSVKADCENPSQPGTPIDLKFKNVLGTIVLQDSILCGETKESGPFDKVGAYSVEGVYLQEQCNDKQFFSVLDPVKTEAIPELNPVFGLLIALSVLFILKKKD